MNTVLLFCSCIIAVIADMLFVWWAKHQNHPLWTLILAIFLNCMGLLIWTYVMRKGIESATAITVYALFTVAGCTYLGNVVFKEPLSFINGVGLSLALVALILLTIKP